MAETYTQIKLTVPGVPVAKGRPRFRKVGNYVQTYTPTETINAEIVIAKAFLETYPGFWELCRDCKTVLPATYFADKRSNSSRRKSSKNNSVGRSGPQITKSIRGIIDENWLSADWASNLRSQSKQYGVSLSCKFYVPIPSTTSKKRSLEMEGKLNLKRPDIDNYIKLVMDALNGIAWEDDNVIASVNAAKIYSSEPRTEVYINYLQNNA